ncbi:MAG: tetratricopeptide repeat protein [Deltaproteobacteria bacterium]|nr:tetratricopeptide repeat protein [Deltaproteobacteria bacterium]
MKKMFLIASVIVLLLIAACTTQNTGITDNSMREQDNREKDTMENKEVMNDKTDSIQKEDGMMDDTMMSKGNRLAGTTTPYLEFNQEDYEKALTYFKKAEAAVSDDLLKILVCYNMGNTLEALHQYEAALKYYEKLLSYDMEFVSQEAHLGLARCYEAMQQLDKAKATYENFAKKYPNSPLLKSEIDNQLFLLEQFGQEYKKYFSKDKK